MMSVSLSCLLVLLCLFTAVVVSYEGCRIRFGSRGCNLRVVKGVVVICDGLSEETLVPHNIPLDTVYLTLVNFKFDSLHRSNFSRHTAIQCLTIMNSGVNSVAVDTFADFNDLHELMLDGTQLNGSSLRFISHEKFNADSLTVATSRRMAKLNVTPSKVLRKLKILDLHGNGLVHVNATLFTEMRSLETLDLSDNRLTSIDWDMMHEINKLNKLKLNGNGFQVIPDAMRKIFFSVKELHLAGNPFHCNCKLKWMKDFFESSVDKELDYNAVQCASPKAEHMQNMDASSFSCQHPAKPIVHWTTLKDGRYVVNCSSIGDPAPVLTITLHDGKKVITPPSTNLSDLETKTPHIITIGGPVLCEAANSEGTIVGVGDIPAPDSSAVHKTSLTAIGLCGLLLYLVAC